jgi:hypothetical protein
VKGWLREKWMKNLPDGIRVNPLETFRYKIHKEVTSRQSSQEVLSSLQKSFKNTLKVE